MTVHSFPATASLAAAIRRGCRMTRPASKLWIGYPGAWLRFKPRGVHAFAVMRARRGGYEASVLGAAYIGTYCTGNGGALRAAAGLLARGLLDIHPLLTRRYPVLHRRILACGRSGRLIDLLARLDDQSFLSREQLAGHVEDIERLADDQPRGRILSPARLEHELQTLFATRARKNLALARSAFSAF